jgi:hypothetical protein
MHGSKLQYERYRWPDEVTHSQLLVDEKSFRCLLSAFVLPNKLLTLWHLIRLLIAEYRKE